MRDGRPPSIHCSMVTHLWKVRRKAQSHTQLGTLDCKMLANPVNANVVCKCEMVQKSYESCFGLLLHDLLHNCSMGLETRQTTRPKTKIVTGLSVTKISHEWLGIHRATISSADRNKTRLYVGIGEHITGGIMWGRKRSKLFTSNPQCWLIIHSFLIIHVQVSIKCYIPELKRNIQQTDVSVWIRTLWKLVNVCHCVTSSVWS